MNISELIVMEVPAAGLVYAKAEMVDAGLKDNM